MKKNIIQFTLIFFVSISASNAHAFDIIKFFSDLFSSAPIAGSRAPQGAEQEEKEGEQKDKEKLDKNGKPIVKEVTVSKLLNDENRCFSHYPLGPPRFQDKDRKSELLYICKKGFAMGYNAEYKNPIWVAEHLENKNLKNKKDIAQYTFSYDPELPTKMQISLDTYKNSGFDRGQLFAPENMISDDEKRQQGYVITNTAPQVGINFNRGIWADLEMWTRLQAKLRGDLYVVTGTLYLGKKEKLPDGTVIPSHFYKVIVDPKMSEAISFIIPNRQVLTENAKVTAGNPKYPQTTPQQVYTCKDSGKSFCNIFDFSTSMKEVERLSGLTFISGVSENHVLKIKVSDDFVKSKRYTKTADF